jgi:hypothetical protein
MNAAAVAKGQVPSGRGAGVKVLVKPATARAVESI